MILNETYPLANGVQIPKLGLGTWFIDDAKAAKAVRAAVKLGYRLIDTAQVMQIVLTDIRCKAMWAQNSRETLRTQLLARE